VRNSPEDSSGKHEQQPEDYRKTCLTVFFLCLQLVIVLPTNPLKGRKGSVSHGRQSSVQYRDPVSYLKFACCRERYDLHRFRLDWSWCHGHEWRAAQCRSVTDTSILGTCNLSFLCLSQFHVSELYQKPIYPLCM
jgi:hypothetical protein